MNMDRRNFLRVVAGTGLVAASSGLAACSGGSSDAGSAAGSASPAAAADFKVWMVTDMGGVNDQSFNELAWAGLQQLADDEGYETGYTESKQEADYATNLDKAVDDECDLIWGVGFALADAIRTAAKTNPDAHFAIIDNTYPEEGHVNEETGEEDGLLDNLTGVSFRTQEPSFVAGYIAAMTTTTNKVGFVGGMQSDVLETFRWGYKAGVAYANAEAGKNVEVTDQYIETFSDAAKGKAAGQKMYSDGCDIVFACAGNAGNGVIESATDANKMVIGVDQDQYDLAPENMLTSVMKMVDKAVIEVSIEAAQGESIGGQNIELSSTDDAVGISEHHDLMSDDTYTAAQDLMSQIKDGEIVPPGTEDDYNEYVASL